MSKEETYDGMILDNVIGITIPTFNFFNRNKKIGQDALILYMFYYKTAKLQKTNAIWATASFCMRGLDWTEERYYKTKKFLIEQRIISQKTTRREKGYIGKTYIILRFKLSNEKMAKMTPLLEANDRERSEITIKSRDPEIQDPVKPGTGQPGAEMLTESKVNASGDKPYAYPPIVPPEGGPITPEPEKVVVPNPINLAIELFRPVNETTVNKLFAIPPERRATEELLKIIGHEGIKNRIEVLAGAMGDKYAPVVTTPRELLKKLAKVDAYIAKLGDVQGLSRSLVMNYGKELKRTGASIAGEGDVSVLKITKSQ